MKFDAMKAALRNRRSSGIDEAHILGGAKIEQDDPMQEDEANEMDDGSDLAPDAEDSDMAHLNHDAADEMDDHAGSNLEQHEAEYKSLLGEGAVEEGLSDGGTPPDPAIKHPNGTAPKQGGKEKEVGEALSREGGSPSALGQKVFKKIQAS